MSAYVRRLALGDKDAKQCAQRERREVRILGVNQIEADGTLAFLIGSTEEAEFHASVDGESKAKGCLSEIVIAGNVVQAKGCLGIVLRNLNHVQLTYDGDPFNDHQLRNI